MRTNAGTDLACDVLGKRTGQPAPADYMALTANATAPAAGDTALTGEITTAGLARAQATYAHTSGTASYTLTKTFTAVAADVSGGTVTVKKVGLLNASSAGVLAFEATLADTPFVAASDSATVTYTVTP